MTDLRQRLQQAAARVGASSSDFDLNPDVRLGENRKLRPAAVLIPILTFDGPPRVALTKRASSLRHHPGQIAFPGGKVEDTDAGPVAAALRETEEEIGLPRDRVEVVADLPSHETVTSFLITPVLGLVAEPFDPVAEPGEVDEVFTVPLDHVADPANYVIEGRFWRGQKRRYYTVPYGPYYVWGATARMLRALAEGMRT